MLKTYSVQKGDIINISYLPTFPYEIAENGVVTAVSSSNVTVDMGPWAITFKA